MTTLEIKAILLHAGAQLCFQMDRHIITGSLAKYQAIERVTQLTQIKREDIFYQLLLEAKPDVIMLMPSAASRYKKLREKILIILQEAEDKCKDELKISDLANAIAGSGV